MLLGHLHQYLLSATRVEPHLRALDAPVHACLLAPLLNACPHGHRLTKAMPRQAVLFKIGKLDLPLLIGC